MKRFIDKVIENAVLGSASVIIDITRFNSDKSDKVDVRIVVMDILKQQFVPALEIGEKVSSTRRVILRAAKLKEYVDAHPDFGLLDVPTHTDRAKTTLPPPPPPPIRPHSVPGVYLLRVLPVCCLVLLVDSTLIQAVLHTL